MRIGVEKTVRPEFAGDRRETVLGERGAIELHSRQRTEVGDLFSMHVLHRQNARRAVIGDRRGNDDVLEAGDLFAQW